MDTTIYGTARYLLLEFKGEGCFGQVAKCFNLQTEEMVAIKIHKHNNNKSIQNEVEMLRQLRALDTDKKNIVKFIDNFEFHGASCLAFEMLDKSLWDLMKQRKMVSLNLSQIRPIIHQLLVAFSALKDMGIMYTDLKPDNVMLVNHEDQPFKIKLIDFGLAIPVYFGLPLTEAVDMWGMGCMMGFFYFGLHLFPSDCDYHWVKAILHMLGQPEHYQLITGQNTWKFFKRENSGWRLRTPVEYEIVTGVRPKVSQRFFDMAQNLEDAVRRCPSKRDPIEYEDRMPRWTPPEEYISKDPQIL
uniref:Protein kinase domain-containing protein n=1 Tax=Lates calcarifer TaxID=8187 RepID=A0A4W6DJH3_LATCA